MWREVDKETNTFAQHLSEEYMYFAYGSNANLTQMFCRCPASKPYCIGLLHDYKLTFRNVADVTKSKGKSVYGALYKVSMNDILSLNHYEGFPYKYVIKTGLAETERGQKKIFWYEIKDKKEHLSNMPSTEYLSKILNGYVAWNMPSTHVFDSLFRCTNAVKRRRRIEVKKQYSLTVI